MTEQKENKNLIWLFLVLAVLAVIFFGFYFYKNSNSVDVVENKTINNTEHTNNGLEKIDIDDLVSSVSDDYKNSDSFKECIGMDMGIQSCLREEVFKKVNMTKDVNFCNDLIGEGKVQDCKNSFYTKDAEEKGDASICNNLTNKDNCLQKVYTKKALMSGNINECSSLNEYQKEQCISRVIRKKAIEEDDISLCDKLVFSRTEGEGESAVTTTETIESDMCKEEFRMEAEFKANNERYKKEQEGLFKENITEEYPAI